MSRRTQPCRTCPGRTRHDDRSCSTCRNLTPVQRLIRSFAGVNFAGTEVAAAMARFSGTFRVNPWQRQLLDLIFSEHAAGRLQFERASLADWSGSRPEGVEVTTA